MAEWREMTGEVQSIGKRIELGRGYIREVTVQNDEMCDARRQQHLYDIGAPKGHDQRWHACASRGILQHYDGKHSE